MKRILKLFIVFIITIFGFELFLRYSPFSNGISPVVYDKDIGMWHKKDFSSYIIKECYQNRYQFDKYGRIKNSYRYDRSKKDIVLLGDSQIEALMVENDKVIHNSLYNELKGKYNVLNYGLSGTGPAQQYQILKHKVDLSNIDTIIHFVFLENDLNDADPKNFSNANRPKVHMRFSSLDNYEVIKPKDYGIKEKVRDFLGNYELYVYLKKSFYYYRSKFKVKQKVDNLSKEQKNFLLENEDFKWKQLIGSIYQINKLANENSINYYIVIFSAYELNDGYNKKRKRFETLLLDNNISSINIVPFLKKLEKKQKLSFSCDGHWNSMTHKKISKLLLKFIKGI